MMKWELFYLELKVHLSFLLNNHLHVDAIYVFFWIGKRQDINKHQKRCTKYTRCIQVCYRAEEEERK